MSVVQKDMMSDLPRSKVENKNLLLPMGRHTKFCFGVVSVMLFIPPRHTY